MSYVIEIRVSGGLPMQEATTLCADAVERHGLELAPIGRPLSRRATGVMVVDSGELSCDDDSRFVPHEGVARAIEAVVVSLHTRRYPVQFSAGWLGQGPASEVEVGLDGFRERLFAGSLRDGVVYRIS